MSPLTPSDVCEHEADTAEGSTAVILSAIGHHPCEGSLARNRSRLGGFTGQYHRMVLSGWPDPAPCTLSGLVSEHDDVVAKTGLPVQPFTFRTYMLWFADTTDLPHGKWPYSARVLPRHRLVRSELLNGWHAEEATPKALDIRCLADVLLANSSAPSWTAALGDEVVVPSQDALPDCFDVRNEGAVLDFLASHGQLRELLREAHEEIQTCFGEDIRMALDIFVDPDSRNFRELFLLVLTDKSVEDAIDAMARLDEEWWIDASERAEGLMNIDIEYIRDV